MLAREQLGPLTDRQRMLVDEAERSCARLSALVAEMSDLSNLESGSAPMAHDDVDLSALVDDVAGRVEEGRDRGVTVARDAEASPLVVTGDRKRLSAIVGSLAVAVLREQGGPATVTLRTCRILDDGRPMAALGIGPADTARIVLEGKSPDARLNEARGGLGLALPVARRVIERLGGRTWSSAAERAVGAIGVLIPLKETRS
jgi:signal transduction histidine kinase